MTQPERVIKMLREAGGSTECIEWPGPPMNTGYGQLSLSGRHHLAHRYVYEQLRGPIPDGLQIDHLCRNRLCVNPNHLEPVTNAVNVQRGFDALRPTCPQGHPRSEYRTTARGRHYCPQCHRAYQSARYHRLFSTDPEFRMKHLTRGKEWKRLARAEGRL